MRGALGAPRHVAQRLRSSVVVLLNRFLQPRFRLLDRQIDAPLPMSRTDVAQDLAIRAELGGARGLYGCVAFNRSDS